MKKLFIGLAFLVMGTPAFADTADDYLADVSAKVSNFLDNAATISSWSCVITDDVAAINAFGSCALDKPAAEIFIEIFLPSPKGSSLFGYTNIVNSGCEFGRQFNSYNFGSAGQIGKARGGLINICKTSQ